MTTLRIREAQLRVLREAAHFYAVEAGLLRHFSEHCAVMTSAELARFILNSRERARSFGLTMPEFQGFASFELIFGNRYWELMEYRWARRILEDKDITAPSERFRILREAVIFHLAAAEEEEDRRQRAEQAAGVEEQPA